jgi:DNA-binding transcriptional ArsR family regulator
MKKVCDVITRLAKISCLQALMRLESGDVISFDGAYDHRRKAGRCLVCICCQRTGEILAYIIVSNKIDKNLPNFCKVPQNMEVHGMKLLIEELKDENGEFRPQISGYVHDNDAKTRNLIKASNWKIKEHLDPGHAMKSFDRVMMKYPQLKPIQLSLRKFMGHLLHSNKLDQAAKGAAWMNALYHYSGIHVRCPFEHVGREMNMRWTKIDENRLALESFLTETKWIAERCVSEFSTQVNESINRSRIKFAIKDVQWGGSYDARMGCAVLDRNWPFWKLVVRDELGLRRFDALPMLQHIAMENRRLVRKARASTLSEKIYEASRRNLQKQRADKELKALSRLGYRQNPNVERGVMVDVDKNKTWL